MIEMEMEKERVERLHLQQLGEDWIQAITGGTFGRLEGFCNPEITSTLLTPKRVTTLDNAVDLAAKYQEWFGACTNFQVEGNRVNRVGQRLGIFYRFRLWKDEAWYTIEQQVYCTLKDGRVERLHLLCSGFQLVAMTDQAALEDASEAGEQDPIRDGLLEFYTGASEAGSTCAVLTPMIRSKLGEMQSGQVLEVRVDDPSARDDIEAWSRLSGNALLKVMDKDGPELRFFVKKK
jgi:TusA-related sulfurtransferase